ncbi:hypothetical protein QR680_005230 [Steinernema hermaphroditum]|uniref:Uncharacterized protein n=1 Tax=Steinernema hermaphroditum TaxID=289476 RepID=A0AA39HSN7_9BILA|nr:hypothetical protein QR680_005230 [Steinernema hermaphroditum]
MRAIRFCESPEEIRRHENENDARMKHLLGALRRLLRSVDAPSRRVDDELSHLSLLYSAEFRRTYRRSSMGKCPGGVVVTTYKKDCGDFVAKALLGSDPLREPITNSVVYVQFITLKSAEIDIASGRKLSRVDGPYTDS